MKGHGVPARWPQVPKAPVRCHNCGRTLIVRNSRYHPSVISCVCGTFWIMGFTFLLCGGRLEPSEMAGD